MPGGSGIGVISEAVRERSGFVEPLYAEIEKRIVGQRPLIENILIGILSRGHIFLEGIPGLAKTLTVKTFAEAIDVGFQRIQFTPDLLPADIIGTQIYDPREAVFKTRMGPVFSNLILADEINRAPAKVQSALLEAMQERQVTIGDRTHKIDEPFLVLATQNPIEQEGTYPLPEAQIDRFMLKLLVGYPSKAEELEIMDRMAGGRDIPVKKVLSREDLFAARETVSSVYLDDKVKAYIVDLIFATREPAKHGLADLAPLIEYGASPRATIFLAEAARSHAFLRHRGYVTPEDVKAMAPHVLRHRVILSYEAEAEEVTSEDVVAKVLSTIEVP